MNETSNKRAIWVGLFVLLGIVFLLAGILMIGNLHATFRKKMQVVAFFDDVGGLQTGNNVWFSGVKIGTVGKLSFYSESQVKVIINLEVKAQEYIRKNAKIKIGSDGLIGNKILIIYDGTSKSGQVEPGDTLQVEKTFTQEDMINTLQENNVNLLSVTKDLKTVSKNLLAGEGTIGKLIADNKVYDNIDAATTSLRIASASAAKLVHSLNQFSTGLNTKGTLANELVTDTIVFSSLKVSAQQFRHMADTANAIINNLQAAEKDPNTAVGVLLHDKETGAHFKETIKNLESSSKKLDENLLAAQHSFLLRGFFRKKEKAEKKAAANK
jgi:phospholipid/cholesterol/gamma-HCH transport system substrate-binding protein